jgi:hypothetical protein
MLNEAFVYYLPLLVQLIEAQVLSVRKRDVVAATFNETELAAKIFDRLATQHVIV